MSEGSYCLVSLIESLLRKEDMTSYTQTILTTMQQLIRNVSFPPMSLKIWQGTQFIRMQYFIFAYICVYTAEVFVMAQVSGSLSKCWAACLSNSSCKPLPSKLCMKLSGIFYISRSCFVFCFLTKCSFFNDLCCHFVNMETCGMQNFKMLHPQFSSCFIINMMAMGEYTSLGFGQSGKY